MKYCNTPFINQEPEILSLFTQWPFELSDFQKWAIYSIYNGNDTLVCALTGSGKTLPAEFAIKYFTDLGKKVIYTTPIKALSNDKFRELTEKFPDISFGILTGDNKCNPEADVLIMTTEIYLNTLKKMRCLSNNVATEDKITLDFNINVEEELGCVVYDEIHYINDRDRGTVVEQSIMLTPYNVSYVGLSATINQPEKVCLWSESQEGAKRKEIYLCETKHRNVPLEHYSFITIPDSSLRKLNPKEEDLVLSMINKPVLLKQQNTHFDEKTYFKMKKALKIIYDRKIKVYDTFVYNKMIDYLYDNNLLPSLTFIFSRKQCYVWANKIQRSLFEESSKIPSIIRKKATEILISKHLTGKNILFYLNF